jgi:polyhydroxybutyrate depolymerase
LTLLFSNTGGFIRLSASMVAVVGALSSCATLAPDVLDGTLARGFTTARHVRMGDWTRDYLLHVPRRSPTNLVGRAQRFPLLIVLHGSGATGETVREQSGMDSVAEAHRFLAAYPDGSGELFGLSSDWNAGECCGGAYLDRVNDIAFLRAIIADVSSRLPVDPRRIYVAGFSDGARMAYRAGCEMASEVAAIAAVAGNLVAARCIPARQLPVIAFHGTADHEVPYNDSAYTPPPRPFPPEARTLPPSVRFWMATDGCRDAEERRIAPHVIRSAGVHCAADVVFYSLEGAGHRWPVDHSGGSADSISASSLIADFFLQHAM